MDECIYVCVNVSVTASIYMYIYNVICYVVYIYNLHLKLYALRCYTFKDVQ